MKAPLASWGVFLLGAAAALGRVTTVSGGDFQDDGVQTLICDDNEGESVTAERVASSSSPLLRDKPLDDRRDLVRVLKGGGLDSNQPAHFTHSTFAVANEQARHEETPSLKPFPIFEASRNKYKGRGSTRHDAPHDSSSSTGNGIVFTARSSISGSGGGAEDSDDTKSGSGVKAARKAARAPTLSTNLIASNGESKRMLDEGSNNHKYEKSRSTVGGWLPGARGATRLIADYRVSKRMLEVFKTLRCNRRQKSTATTNLLRGSAHKQPFIKRSMVCPSDPWLRKPTCALQVGESLTGTLRSADGHFSLWPGVDGSLRFGNVCPVTCTSLSEDGGEEGSGPGVMRFTTLLCSDSEKAWKALGARRMFRHEEGGQDLEAMRNAKETVGGWLPRARRAQTNIFGVDNASGKHKGTVGGWLPRAQRTTSSRLNMGGASGEEMGMVDGWLPRARDAKRTISNMDNASSEKKETVGGWLPWPRGRTMQSMPEDITKEARSMEEVCVSVTNKGCVKVTVDGTTVLSKSGNFKWDWLNRVPWIRPKDDGYQLHVTDTGAEIRLGERKVWGIDADEWMG